MRSLFADINECSDSVCEQICDNLPGSFQCRCQPGYFLAADGVSCFIGETYCSCLCMLSLTWFHSQMNVEWVHSTAAKMLHVLMQWMDLCVFAMMVIQAMDQFVKVNSLVQEWLQFIVTPSESSLLFSLRTSFNASFFNLQILMNATVMVIPVARSVVIPLGALNVLAGRGLYWTLMESTV